MDSITDIQHEEENIQIWVNKLQQPTFANIQFQMFIINMLTFIVTDHD